MIVKPDSAGEIRSGCDERAEEVWEKTTSRLHFSLDFRINSQPLAACLTPELSIGGRAWPNFLCTDRRWETPLVLWANTILGLISFWWIGARQQQGRAVLTITKLPALTVLDPQALTVTQLDHADRIFEEFKNQDMLPANVAWRDKTRQALDRAVLIDLLGPLGRRAGATCLVASSVVRGTVSPWRKEHGAGLNGLPALVPRLTEEIDTENTSGRAHQEMDSNSRYSLIV